MGLFLVQILLVIYQFTYTTDAGRPESNARATRLGPAVVVGHLLLSITAALLWMGWKAFGNDGFAWATFIVLAVAALLGTLMVRHSMFSPAHITPPSSGPSGAGGASGETLPAVVVDPADTLTAESRIPVISHVLLGLFTLTLLVFTLLTAVGVFHQP